MLDYFDVLADLHRERRPRTYLEIGVWRGDTLRLALKDTVCVGVDPEPTIVPAAGHHFHLEVMTSDAFFASRRPREIFGDLPVDLVFIDGMHLFEYALRDFLNAEAMATAESLIVLHDCLPKDAVTASRKRSTEYWTGDTWKLPLCLLDHRPDLNLSIIDVAPSGLCLIRGLNPADRTLLDCYDDLVAQYRPMEFAAWEARVAEVMERTMRSPETQLWSLRKDLAALRDRLGELEAQLNESTTWAHELNDQFVTAHRELDAAHRELDIAHRELDAAMQELARLNSAFTVRASRSLRHPKESLARLGRRLR